MRYKPDYSLYLVTDTELMSSSTLAQSIQLAIDGGVTMVQVREKAMETATFYADTLEALALTRKAGIPLIVNDRVDIALAAGADGVHVGQSDLPAKEVRRLIGSDMLLGVSAASLEQAQRAEADGADYLGVGALYFTGTKTDAEVVSFETLVQITQAVNIPVVAIGGMNAQTIPKLKNSGVQGAAVVSAIVSQTDVTAAAQLLKGLVKEALY